MVEHEYKKKDNLKIILIIWAVISILVILTMYNIIKGQDSYLQDMYKTYQYVPEGKQGFYCDTSQQYLCYDKNQYAVSYDPKTDSIAQCNILQNQQATCVTSTNGQMNYAQCKSGEYPYCIPEGRSWQVCNAGEIATCNTKGLYAIFSGSSSYSCNAGETAYCQTQ